MTRWASVVVAVGVVAVPTMADVFNMGGTRNSDGSWTGLASLETVTVGNPGNSGELSGDGVGGYGTDRICGAVDYVYNIGKYEVTAAQYCEFLNAVAATDTYRLYHPSMWSSEYGCKIQRSGSSGSYTYSVAADYANRPVNYVNYWSACRFANWLHNDQPTGAQGPATTETGAYTLGGYEGRDGQTIQRNAGWKWAVTSEDEWYKAAYHKNDGVTGNYWDYPTGSNSVPSNDLINPDPGNNANILELLSYPNYDLTIGSPYWRTPVGEFENSESPYGTFDQGGNVCEWTESIVLQGPTYAARVSRGGSFFGSFDMSLPASDRFIMYPSDACMDVGFRVSAVPEPATLALLAFGGLALLRRRRGWRQTTHEEAAQAHRSVLRASSFALTPPSAPLA